VRTRIVLIVFFLLTSTAAGAQSRALTEKEKTWIDSLDHLLGYKNPWFDSLMQADGRVMRTQSLGHYIEGDTSKDVLAFSRAVRNENHEPYILFFDYYFKEGKIVAHYGPEIYLQPPAARIVEFHYGPYGGQENFTLSSGGKVLFSTSANKRDTVIPGFSDTSKYIVIIPLKLYDQHVITYTVGRQLGTTKNSSGETIYLSECSVVQWLHSTGGTRGRALQKPFLLSSATPAVTGDTIFAQLEARIVTDTVHHLLYEYFSLVRTFGFDVNQLERVFQSSALARSKPVLPYPVKKEKRVYRRFVRRLPLKRDPSGIYFDPVVRWMYRQKRFS
jgi:hypothetical protein